RDHPQSFTDVAAWWPYYRTHGDHLARVSYLLTRGRPHNRLLLLEATTSGFLWARRGGATPELERMRRDNAELIQALADRQVDFDLGDEYILEWHGKADGARLAVGNARYDLLVWPANMVNLRSQTLPLLEKYLAGGGHVLGLAAPAAYVDGRPNGQPAALAARYAGQWHQVSGADALIEEARKRLPARVTFESALPPGVGLLERELENGDRLLFLANTGLAPVKTNAMTDGGGLEEWDTSAGSVSPARFEPVSAGRIRFPIDLAPAGSTLLRITRSGKPRPPVQEDTVAISPRSWQVTPDALNVLPLDYCDLTVAGVEHRNIHTWKANWEIWQQHGFERPAWDNAVQYRTRVFDRNHFGPDSGFEARFAFEIASVDALPGLELAVEVPELYHVTVNGRAVSFIGAARWLDPHLRSISIESLTRVGENEIVVSGRPFDVRMELENVYLRGRFSVKAASRGFRLEAAQRLSYGSWAKQGYPFYSDAVLYQTDLDVPAGRGRLEVSLGEWQGSVVEVLLDGRRAAVLGWPPYRAVFPAGPGHHSIGIRVVATPRNLFGPFHNSTKPRMRAWPAAWADFPDHQPPGEAYDLLDYGMTAPPRIRAIREHL
ncbi:MAG TPA: hypothetical protein VG672_02440, partial [Bryobacteraceae bacterium]|nr:hypothetical protein [Bryobacteraceae bacterium]